MTYRVNYLLPYQFFSLNQACRPLDEAFGMGLGIFQVGSSLCRKDYRDVDVRCILADDEFKQMFPQGERSALWNVICSSISLWLAQQTGLPIDFQIQQQTAANKEFDGRRNALGIESAGA